MRLDALDVVAVNALIREMSREAEGFAHGAAGGRPVSSRASAFMRYAGQGHEIAVALPDRPLVAGDAQPIRQAFEAAYAKLFARHIPHAAIEIMSWVVVASTPSQPPSRLQIVSPRAAQVTPTGTRSVIDTRTGQRVDAAVYDRTALRQGERVDGPCLIAEAGTTTWVSPTFVAHVDVGGALVLETKARST
jgi:N-methylhydantoinase A